MAAMTAQEIFDKVTTHLLTQMKQSKSMIGGGACVYRGPDGLMCALGCLIEDSEYSQGMEMTLSALLEQNLCPKSMMNRLGITPAGEEFGHKTYGGNTYLLNQLQYVHDATKPDEWRDNLKKLAITLKLQFNPPAEK